MREGKGGDEAEREKEREGEGGGGGRSREREREERRGSERKEGRRKSLCVRIDLLIPQRGPGE